MPRFDLTFRLAFIQVKARCSANLENSLRGSVIYHYYFLEVSEFPILECEYLSAIDCDGRDIKVSPFTSFWRAEEEIMVLMYTVPFC